MGSIIESASKGLLSSGISAVGSLANTASNRTIQEAKLLQDYKIKEAELDNSRRDRIMRAIGNIHGPLSLITTGIGLMKTKGNSKLNYTDPELSSSGATSSPEALDRYKATLEKELKRKKPRNLVVHELRKEIAAGEAKFKGGSKWKTKK